MRLTIAAAVLSLLATACVIDGTTSTSDPLSTSSVRTTVVVPDVVGLNVREARRQLQRLGLAVVIYLVQTQIVSEQQPAAGSTVQLGSKVLLLAGSGIALPSASASP